jgi:hypothetical protein
VIASLALLTLGVLQGGQPLRKADLVRLLATGSLTKPAIAALVRRNCVTFRPSARDRAELRTAGADDAVLGAIDQCLRARTPMVRPAAPPPPVVVSPQPTDQVRRPEPPPPPPPPPPPTPAPASRERL